MTNDTARRVLGRIVIVALAIAVLGSLALVAFRQFLSRFPTQWG
jgi:hypothetical protein